MHDFPYRCRTNSNTINVLLALAALITITMWFYTIGVADQNSRSYVADGTFRYAMVQVLTGVNLQDAKVAVKVNWSKHMESIFPEMESEFEILPDVQSAADMIAKGKLHGLSMGISQFLELSRTVPLNPVFISSRLDTPLESYLLVVRRGISWERLSAKPTRRLITEKAEAPNIGHKWLEVLLHERNLTHAHAYFTTVSAADKPARIVLPVFFGQADACLVPESAYRTMIELNPQIDQELIVLARSPGFIKTINCTTELMPKHMVARFVEKGIPMTDTVDGRQLLLIFHVKKNFFFEPEFLTDSQRIFQAYEKLVSPVAQ